MLMPPGTTQFAPFWHPVPWILPQVLARWYGQNASRISRVIINLLDKIEDHHCKPIMTMWFCKDDNIAFHDIHRSFRLLEITDINNPPTSKSHRPIENPARWWRYIIWSMNRQSAKATLIGTSYQYKIKFFQEAAQKIVQNLESPSIRKQLLWLEKPKQTASIFSGKRAGCMKGKKSCKNSYLFCH